MECPRLAKRRVLAITSGLNVLDFGGRIDCMNSSSPRGNDPISDRRAGL
jgi:hypothetical protein